MELTRGSREIWRDRGNYYYYTKLRSPLNEIRFNIQFITAHRSQLLPTLVQNGFVDF